MSALALGRQIIEGWNDGRLETGFAAFDESVVVRTNPTWPDAALRDEIGLAPQRGRRASPASPG